MNKFKTTLLAVAAWAGSKVTVWVMTAGLVHFTVSPTLILTVAGTNTPLGLFFIETSTVWPSAKAGVAMTTPRLANISVKARRSIFMGKSLSG